MVVVDANVLIYAHWEYFPQNDEAKDWLATALVGSERVGFAGITLVAYLRLATSGKFLSPALPMAAACGQIEACLAAPAATYLGDGPRTWPLVRSQLLDYRVRGNLTNDAYLAALALEHGATVVTFDRDFARFANVRVRYLG